MSCPKISIIIPVYNAGKFLSKCIDSVLAQTYTDWELVLVNDGSKDDSGEICDRYSSEDSRIRVVHKQNGGAASARNTGLKEAKGEYVVFIDSDDYISSELLTDYMDAGDYDLVISCFNILWNNHIKQINARSQKMLCLKDIVNYMSCDDKIFVGSPCNKLYKRSIIEHNSIRFTESVNDICEDLIFNWEYFVKCHNACAINKQNYFYIENPDSITHTNSFRDMQSILHRLKAMSELYDRMDSIADTHLKSTAMRSCHVLFSDTILRSIYLFDFDKKTRIDLLKRFKQQINRAGKLKLRSVKGIFNKIIAIQLYLPCVFADPMLYMIFKSKKILYHG